MNKDEYELARPGQQPLPLVELRPSMNPEQLYARTEKNEYLINKATLADKRDDNPNRLRVKAEREPQTTFEIRVGTPDQPKDQWQLLAGSITELEEAKASLAFHKEHNAEDGKVVAMRKNVELISTFDPAVWAKEREATGEWEFPEWLNESWVKPETHESFLHLSVGQVGNVAYYPTKAAAQNDKCAIETAGHYLVREYGDVLDPNEISKIVYNADPPGELVLSGSDPDAIEAAYKENIYSCMRGKKAPRVYGAGDIEMLTLVRNGKTIARALAWPERKFVGNVYGDTVRMKMALELHGYSRDFKGQSTSRSEGLGGFEGARLLKVRQKGSWLMPWIDLGYRVWDDGEFFRLSKNRGVCVNNTTNTFSGEIPFFEPEKVAA